MRKLMRISALLLVVMLAVFASRMPNAMAQDSTPAEGSGTFEDLTQLEGLESAVSRSWSVDYESLIDATPAEGEDFALPEGIQLLSAAVFQFDSEDNATAARDKATEEVNAETAEELELEEIEVEGLNEDTVALGATTEDAQLGATQSVVIITQEGEYLYIALGVAIGEEVDTAQTTADVVASMIDADAGEGEGTFNEDGTSEGGLWDKLPDADDDLVSGLIATDEQVYPEPEDAA